MHKLILYYIEREIKEEIMFFDSLRRAMEKGSKHKGKIKIYNEDGELVHTNHYLDVDSYC